MFRLCVYVMIPPNFTHVFEFPAPGLLCGIQTTTVPWVSGSSGGTWNGRMEAGGKVQHLNQTCGGGGGKREEKKPLGRKNAVQSVEEKKSWPGKAQTHRAKSIQAHGASVNLQISWHDWKTKHTPASFPQWFAHSWFCQAPSWDLCSWGLLPCCSREVSITPYKASSHTLSRKLILRELESGSACA